MVKICIGHLQAYTHAQAVHQVHRIDLGIFFRPLLGGFYYQNWEQKFKTVKCPCSQSRSQVPGANYKHASTSLYQTSELFNAVLLWNFNSGTPYLLDHFLLHSKTLTYLTAARLAQLQERRSAERKVVRSNPAGPSTKVFKKKIVRSC